MLEELLFPKSQIEGIKELFAVNKIVSTRQNSVVRPNVDLFCTWNPTVGEGKIVTDLSIESKQPKLVWTLREVFLVPEFA